MPITCEAHHQLPVMYCSTGTYQNVSIISILWKFILYISLKATASQQLLLMSTIDSVNTNNWKVVTTNQVSTINLSIIIQLSLRTISNHKSGPYDNSNDRKSYRYMYYIQIHLYHGYCAWCLWRFYGNETHPWGSLVLCCPYQNL